MGKSFIKNGVRVRELKNDAEHQFAMTMLKRGWAPTKRGWPDFFCVHKDGRICAVEVKKAANYSLSREQELVLKTLAKHGIDCFRWDPEGGFVKITDTITTDEP